MEKPLRRYYDTNAVINFFSRAYQQKYNDFFPARNIRTENYICPLILEESCYIFNIKIKKGENKQEDVYNFIKYLKNYSRAVQMYQAATQLFLSAYPSFLSKGLFRVQKGEKDKVDVRDLFSYCIAIVHEFDLFVTFDDDFKIIEDNTKLIGKSTTFPKIKLLPKLP